ncbi:hypothetical protein V5O48_013980 [Marasmius crinis-equi]|uniref:F-box domain-containing protein n=1 Tax=Marasmius crinis-equi TaxID=585013 RepID=A0ABR3EYK5_9AGAR
MLSDSSFASVLNTNYAPSPQEIAEIKTIIRNPIERLKVLHEELSRLQAERNKVQTFIDDHRALLAPFRRLPTDLWVEIFAQCLSFDGPPTRALDQAPLLLTIICRSWREIALGTPKLWNAIHVNLPLPLRPSELDRYNSALLARRGGVQRWLDRSAMMPLNISMSVGFCGTQWGTRQMLNPDVYSHFGGLAVQHSRRWKEITFTGVPDAVMDSIVSQITHGSLPILEKISVAAVRTHLPQNPQTALIRLLEAAETSRLRVLHMRRFPESILELKTSHWVHIAQLMVVDPIGDLLPSMLIDRIVQLCPSLETCMLAFSSHVMSLGISSQPYSGPPQVWPHLRKLVLTFFGLGTFRATIQRDAITIAEIANIFNAIITPSLAELSISHIVDPSLTDFGRLARQTETPFRDFIVNSGCGTTLTHLSVKLLLSHEAFRQSLGILESLTYLSVEQQPLPPLRTTGTIGGSNNSAPTPLLDRHLFRALTPRLTDDGATVLCPGLEELVFVNCSPDDVGAILELARARADPVSPSEIAQLRSFRAKFGVQPKAGVERLNSDFIQGELNWLRSRDVRVEWSWVEESIPVMDYPGDGILAL